MDSSQFNKLIYKLTTNNIEITAKPKFIEEQSSAINSFFTWSYNITIRNLSTEDVQLTDRYWQIINANGQVKEVSGEGVVGIKPIIKPNEIFEYSSTTNLTTTSGMMIGKYKFIRPDGNVFEATIPSFSLDCPNVKMSVN